MYEQVVKRGIQVYDEWYVMNLATSDEADPNDRECHGVVAYDVQSGNIEGFKANNGVVLATGGPGQAFDHTTNAVSCTGDGHAMAYRAGAPLEDMEFIQFHPTSLPSTGVLISEGVRGEGGILYNNDGERFMFEYGYANNDGELASRDVVARAELTEVNEGRGVDDEYVHLDMRHLGEERIIDRLENILHLAEDFEGVDGLVEPMPVKPGQHYAMGGIDVDENGQTCINGLYAAGECACVSVHGGNRLGGNALPELIVFGKRAGRHAAGETLGEPEIETGYGDDVEDETDADLPVQPGATGLETSGDVAADGGVTASVDSLERAVERERERVERLMEKDSGIQHAEIRSRLQNAMTDYVNVFRTEEGIKKALRIIATAASSTRTSTSTTLADVQHRPPADLRDAQPDRRRRDDRTRCARAQRVPWRSLASGEPGSRRRELAQTHAHLLGRRRTEYFLPPSHPRGRGEDLRAESSELLTTLRRLVFAAVPDRSPEVPPETGPIAGIRRDQRVQRL